jgi:hypothetical protein
MSPTIVSREVHGHVVPVKLYPPAAPPPWREDDDLLEEIERVLDDLLGELQRPSAPAGADR